MRQSLGFSPHADRELRGPDADARRHSSALVFPPRTASRSPRHAAADRGARVRVLDPLSGQTLAAAADDDRFEPASLTKLMTRLPRLRRAARGQARARHAGRRLRQRAAKAGGVAHVRRARASRWPWATSCEGMIVHSGNDAAIALAEAVAGIEDRVRRAHERAGRSGMGLANTRFANATGKPAPGHHASARDLATARRGADLATSPSTTRSTRRRSSPGTASRRANRNRLLWTDPTVDGMKTGFTEAAGLLPRGERAARRAAPRRRSCSGAQSDTLRTAESQKLLNFGFQAYETRRLYQQGRAASATPEVFKGTRPTVRAGLRPRRLAHAAARASSRACRPSLETRQPFVAPLAAGRESGDNEAHARQRAGRRIPRRRPRGRARSRASSRAAGTPSDSSSQIAMTAPIAHFNGQAAAPRQDLASRPLDRGFIFGDGVYEVIPVYDGVPLRGARALRAAAALDGRDPAAEPAHGRTSGWRSPSELLAHHPGNQAVYIQVTRGVPPKRDHVIPKGLAPTVFMMSQPARLALEGAWSKTASPASPPRDFRWEKCHIKSTSLLGNVLARQMSADAGAIETILFRDGFLTEASASNVFVVKDGTVARARRSDNLILLGITYDLLAQLATEGTVKLEVRPDHRGGGARGRRGLALVLHQGSARGDHARRQARGQRQARPAVPAHARALPGATRRGWRARTPSRLDCAIGQRPDPTSADEQARSRGSRCSPSRACSRSRSWGGARTASRRSSSEIVQRHAPDFHPETIEMRTSKNGRYLSLTVTINAKSREQLDALYSELSKHPMVMMVL